jgi:hypothetical protein
MLEHIEEKLKNYQEEADQDTKERLTQITCILKGEIRDRLYLQFLKKNNHTDVQHIMNIKKAIG